VACVIPGGMTIQLQHLGGSVNKPCENYSTGNMIPLCYPKNCLLTSSGKIKKSSASVPAVWVLKAWRQY